MCPGRRNATVTRHEISKRQSKKHMTLLGTHFETGGRVVGEFEAEEVAQICWATHYWGYCIVCVIEEIHIS